MRESGTVIGTLRGQGDEFARLRRSARGLGLHHGVLLEGPAGVGKTLAALELTASLLCENAEAEDYACGTCRACTKVGAGNHPDVHVIEPPTDKRTIPVEAIRAIRATLDLRPVEGRARAVVIDPADGLNEQGQNALLKTLEEPGPATFLLLTARRPEGLLPTVRSRVQRYRLRPLDSESLALGCADLGGDPELRRRAVAVAGGSLGLAREFCGAGDLDGLLANLLAGRISAVAAARDALEGAEGRAAAERRARVVLRWCGAVCRRQLTADSSLASDRAAPYAARPDPWIDASEAVFAAEEDLAVEIGAPQALTELFVRWSEILAVGGARAG